MTQEKPIKLHHPVYTMEGKLLIPKGTDLTNEMIDALLLSSPDDPYPSASLLKHGSVKHDLFKFLKMPPYNEIFSENNFFDEIFSKAERIRLIAPILDSLYYFRQYDYYTYRHILVVFSLSTRIAQDLISGNRIWAREATAGTTHDIGKICVPLPILNKSLPLTRFERTVMRHHAVAGYVLLCYYQRDSRSLSAWVARDHHERNDGSGYPRGVPISDPFVEIIAVADIYDALISSRSYRPVSFDNRSALEEITDMAKRGELGWPALKALIALNRKDKPHHSEVKVSSEKRGTSPPGNVYGVTEAEKSTSSGDY
jgi:HD-GYP domain-containing protein (c-di-GMP phosphodiesterase class II)